MSYTHGGGMTALFLVMYSEPGVAGAPRYSSTIPVEPVEFVLLLKEKQDQMQCCAYQKENVVVSDDPLVIKRGVSVRLCTRCVKLLDGEKLKE